MTANPSARRIGMIISRWYPTAGGMEIQCERLSKALVSRGHHVTVITEGSRREDARESTQDGVRVIRIPVRGRRPLSSILFFIGASRYLLNHPVFDLFHAHMLATPALIASWTARRLKIPYLVKVAGAGATGDLGTSRLHWWSRIKIRWLAGRVNCLVCPSPATRQEIERSGFHLARIREIPNGVDTDHFRPLTPEDRSRLRQSAGIPAGARVAVYSGRWVPGKGIERLLEIWREGTKRPDWNWQLRLVIAGSNTSLRTDNWTPAMKAWIQMDTNVRDTALSYQMSDVAILLSDAEGLSNFLLEAMSCGLPIIASTGAAFLGAEDSERTGWTLPMRSLESSVQSLLLDLQHDPAPLTAKGTAARRLIEERYSLTRVSAQYERLYEEILNPTHVRN